MFLSAFFWMIPLLFLLGLVFIGVSIGARKESDPGGRRPYALYLLSVIFIAILASFASVAGVGSKAVELIVTDYENVAGDLNVGLEGTENDGEFGFTNLYEETRGQDVSGLVNFGLVLVISLALLAWHWYRSAELKSEPTFAGSPAERTYTAYVYLTVFAALLVFTGSVIFGLLAIGDALFPSDLGSGPSGLVRDFAYAEIAASALAGGAAVMVFRYHWGEGSRLREGAQPPPEPLLT